MPDEIIKHQKFHIQHRLFAAVERWVKETRVFSVDVEEFATVSEVELCFKTCTHDQGFNLSAEVTGLPIMINTQTYEVVEGLTRPRVEDAAIAELETKITDVSVEIVKTASVHDVPVNIGSTTTVKDFFKVYNVKPRFHYNCPVKSIDFSQLKPVIHGLGLVILPHLQDNIFAFRRLTVEQAQVVLSYLSEKAQLEFWRKAVEKTGKEPRRLKLIGVYSSVAYDCIDNVKINYSLRRLSYNFKSHIPRDRGPLRDIGIFRDMDSEKTVMVRK